MTQEALEEYLHKRRGNCEFGAKMPNPSQQARSRGTSVTVSATLVALSFVVAGLGVSVSQQAEAAQTITFVPVADSYVRADRPTRNFGAGTKLRADAAPTTRSLMKFDLSELGNADIESATLRLRATTLTDDGGTIGVITNDTWSESGVTWNNAPASGVGPSASIGAVTAKTWQSVDVTALLTSAPVQSLDIASSSAAEAVYIAREGSATLRPQLVIVASPQADVTEPQVTITSPSEGSTATGDLEVVVDAADDTALASVELLLDGDSIETDTSPPYDFSINTATLTNGPHILQARARDVAGNSALSTPVSISVDNPVDSEPPSAPTDPIANVVRSQRVDLSWTASQDNVAVDHYVVFRDGSELTSVATPEFSDRSVTPETNYTYFFVAYDSAGNPSEESLPVNVTTPPAAATFTFAAAGDLGARQTSSSSFAALDRSSAEFFLALGDMDYDHATPDSTWCDFVYAQLPTKGPAFPFELVAGNHEQEGGPDGYILNHTACLPDRLDSVAGPDSMYGAEYYFDYPADNPLMRVLMLSPQLTIEGTKYTYDTGSRHRTWVADAIDDARALDIPWVTVGMHYHCISLGGVRNGCPATLPLWNLLLAKKVDLILNGHEHFYQRSHQLGLNPSTCTGLKANTFLPGCIVGDGADNEYVKGMGTVNVLAGGFGQSLTSINPLDPETPYIANYQDNTFGYVEYDVSSERIDARFVPTTGNASDSFSIKTQ